MSKIIRKLDELRRDIWRAVAGKDEASHVAHGLVAAIGSVFPAAFIAWPWGPLVGVVAGFALSELWLLFFAGREVVDYLTHRAKGDKPGYVRDGIGDLAGPVIVHLVWWIALVSLLS